MSGRAYSDLNAVNGSTASALRSGAQHANSASMSSKLATVAIINGTSPA
jgi:hypothetical protein